ncbi:MAG TPA: class I SAM-dependent methyltransferase [Kofleriaceae bacterium]|nr:class I SAM-dependent methyltransferase [Kofleriaceae bacterium]
MFGNRLAKRFRHLRSWATREGVTCFRVYDRDIPEVPVVVDLYEGHVVIGDRRHEAADDEWIDEMSARAKEVLGAADVFVKRRERHAHRAGDQYERAGDQGAWFVVGEGGHRFHVNLSDYLDTGLFLDHRITRARVQAEAVGKRVLNLYCYTGAFTVYAARGGAASSTSVDLSKTYLDWAAKNLALNELDPRRHELVHADVRAFLEDSAARGVRWDLAVVDPPTFSNSKRMDYVFDIERDQGPLLQAVAKVIAPGGAIWFSTNKKRFTLDEDSVRGWEIADLTRETIPTDFRDATAHRVWRLIPSTRARRA